MAGIGKRFTITRDEMRKIDALTIREFGIAGVVLMENAGRESFRIINDILDGKKVRKILLFCGKGNNGGDGFVIARHLFNNDVAFELYLLAQPESITGDAKTNFEILKKMGVPYQAVSTVAEIERLARTIYEADIIIDAIFGTGLTGPVKEPFDRLIQMINASNAYVVSIDIPSGLDADDGSIASVAVKADTTITMAIAKQGFFMGRGPDYVGKLCVVDISIPKSITI